MSKEPLSEEDLDGRHLVVSLVVSIGTIRIKTYALIDCGASGFAFVDSSFAHHHRIPLALMKNPRILELADGRPVSSGKLTHLARLNLDIASHSEPANLLVTSLGHYPIVLGIKWLQIHDVSIRWAMNSLTFNSPYCRQHCLDNSESNTVIGITNVPELRAEKPLVVESSASPDLTAAIEDPSPEAVRFNRPGRLNRRVNSKLIAIATPSPILPPTLPVSPILPWTSPVPSLLVPPPTHKNPPLSICMIGAAPSTRLAKKKECKLFTVNMRDIEHSLKPKPEVDPATVLPSEYHEFLDVFSKKEADKLPGRRSHDHKIPLMNGKEPTYGPLYGMSRDELLVLQKYLTENLKKGFIRSSSSPAASPVLFVRKPGGGLRFCVDYRALNAITIKNRYPLPLIRETLDRLSKAVIFTKLDIVAAFNRLRVAHGEEWKTAFRTRYGLYEYLVMPFGLCGAPSSFQEYINDVLREYLDIFCTAYIDDILLYSNSLKEHKDHVRKVLMALQKAGLQLDISKCEFHVTETIYLGLIISKDGIRMDPKKIETIQNWNTPENLKDVQAFIGFANFYRRFVKGFSRIAGPLTAMSKKKIPFVWTDDCAKAFEDLKAMFTSNLALLHFDPDKESVVETDSSDYVNAGVLSQYDDDGVLRPVAFFSRRLSPVECNYEIYDKELLAIIRAFEEWRPELQGAAYPVKVITDHKNLEYFTTTKQLSRRQARWAEYLSRFDFKITYRPGKLGGKPDALTRRSGDLPKEGDVRLEHQNQVVLKPHNFELHANNVPRVTDVSDSEPDIAPTITPDIAIEPSNLAPALDSEDKSIDELIDLGYEHDPTPNKILTLLRNGARHSKDITLAECEDRNGRLYYKERLYVPDWHELKMRLCKEYHDSPVAGHPGRSKTFSLMARDYYWPRYHQFIARYVQHCHTCSRSKASHHAKYGVLKPFPVPQQRWKDISMDFVTGLPESSDKNAVLSVVCRLTKMKHFIPCRETTDAKALARLYVEHVWKLHGLPDSIVSDRGGQFIADFWKALCERLRINSRLSTSFHPETDGQTERYNAVMEQYLRSYVSYQQDDWTDWLPMAEFASNNSDSETTSVSPFLANYGFHPRLGFEPVHRDSPNAHVISADEFAFKMQSISEHLGDEMRLAQARYEASANASRTPAPMFQIGDEVWLDARHIKTKRPSRKLD